MHVCNVCCAAAGAGRGARGGARGVSATRVLCVATDGRVYINSVTHTRRCVGGTEITTAVTVTENTPDNFSIVFDMDPYL